MTFPNTLKYSKSHEWVKQLDDMVEIGMSYYAQKEMSDIVYVNLPMEDDELIAGESFADVESVKAVADIYSPVTGIVAEVNEELLDAPQSVNETPYDAWFIRVKEISDMEELMDAEEYEAFIEEEKNKA